MFYLFILLILLSTSNHLHPQKTLLMHLICSLELGYVEYVVLLFWLYLFI